MTNQEMFERILKAIATTSDMASGGKLSDEQADKLIDYVINETVLSGNARIVRPKSENWLVDKINVAGRVAMPATEATAITARRGVAHTRVTLTPHEIAIPFGVSDTYKEVNLEGPDVEDHLIRMFAAKAANNLEQLYIGGDTVGPAVIEADLVDGGSAVNYIKDAFLAIQDGWLRQADTGGHIVDAAGANFGASTMTAAMNALPNKYKRNRADLRWWTSSSLAQLWLERVSTRATAAGDTALGGTGQAKPFGVPMIEAPLFDHEPQIVQHVVLTGTTATALRYAPIKSASETVLPSTLAATAVAKFSSVTDYLMDYTAGTIARRAGSTIGDGDTVKVTYQARPQVILTPAQNIIMAIGRDIRLERDRDIFARTNLFCLTIRVDTKFEETDAVVKLTNLGLGV